MKNSVTPSTFVIPAKAGIFSLILFFISLFFLKTASAADLLIIDAGSSGSRLYHYRVQGQEVHCLKTHKLPLPIRHLLHKDKRAYQEWLTVLMEPVKEVNPNAVSVWILATAGMRDVGQKDSHMLYQRLRDVLHEKGYREVKVGTLPGRYEAALAWLDAYRQWDDAATQVGIIELGGASVQLAYPVNKKQANFYWQIEDKNHPLYVMSQMGAGVDRMQTVFLQACPLRGRWDGKDWPYDRCLHAIEEIGSRWKWLKYSPSPEKNVIFVALSGFQYMADFFHWGDAWYPQMDASQVAQCRAHWSGLLKNTAWSPFMSSYCFAGVYSNYLLRKEIGNHYPVIFEKSRHWKIDWTQGAAFAYAKNLKIPLAVS